MVIRNKEAEAVRNKVDEMTDSIPLTGRHATKGERSQHLHLTVALSNEISNRATNMETQSRREYSRAEREQ